MTEIFQGSTQTLQITLPTSVDLSSANIYFSIEQFGNTVLEKTGSPDVSYEDNIVSVDLHQIDTLALQEGDAKVQINITADEGATRIPTYEAPIKVLRNQIRRVLQ